MNELENELREGESFTKAMAVICIVILLLVIIFV